MKASDMLSALILITVFLILAYTGYSVSSAMAELLTLEASPCNQITVIDKFTTESGGIIGGDHTNYYIVGKDTHVYKVLIGGNTTEMYLWQILRNNHTYSIRLSNNGEYAAFCDFKGVIKR